VYFTCGGIAGGGLFESTIIRKHNEEFHAEEFPGITFQNTGDHYPQYTPSQSQFHL
jgi:hypothetical protein